jgi:transposase
MRSIAAVTAIGLVAEIGDFERFATAPKLMGYLGLVPSEHSSGERTARGSITKTGNSHARKMLTEAAWNYRYPARMSKDFQARQAGTSEAVQTAAWKAQMRLTRRFSVLTWIDAAMRCEPDGQPLRPLRGNACVDPRPESKAGPRRIDGMLVTNPRI